MDPPSSRRRWAAVVSLVSTAALAVAVVVLLVRHPGLLVGGLLGLALVVAGAWWAVTERMPRRAVGIVLALLGAAAIGLAVVRSLSGATAPVLALLLLAGLAVLATTTARVAMLRELHEPARRAAEVHEPPRRPVLLCNPWSGGGKVERFGLTALAAELGVETVLLDHGLDLAQLAHEAIAKGADCLGMAGGDGSQALVASIAIDHDLPFVCISAGTRNHFALDLGLDREDPRTGMVAFRDGVERRVDYATVGDRLFVNNVSLGIYATIVQEEGYRDAKRETSRQLLPELLGRQAEPFDLQFTRPDGVVVDGAFMVLVSNNPYVLGPALDISQRRSIETGTLGVVAVTARTGLEAAAMVVRSTTGLGRRDPRIHQFATTTFEIRSHSGQVFAGVDGESLELPTPLEFAIHPAGLRLRVPPDSLEVAARRRAHGLHPGELVTIARGRSPVPAAQGTGGAP
ncbi:diacylglycerol kinase [Nocardioides sp. Soil805]|nr:diacylglycerol kinase [Nocardioides sp. Soil805]